MEKKRECEGECESAFSLKFSFVFAFLSCLYRTVDYIFYGEKNENVKEKNESAFSLKFSFDLLGAYPVYIGRFITSLKRIKTRGKDPLSKLSLKSLSLLP